MVQVKNILVFCLPGIGDALLFTPAFRALKRDLPHARVTALCMYSGTAQILRHDSNVDEVLFFDFIKQGILRTLKFCRALRARNFDTLILGYPSNRLEYNIIARFIGTGARIGHRYKNLDIVCGNFLCTHSVVEDDALSNIEENLRLVGLVTGNSGYDPHVTMTLPEDAARMADQWLVRHRILGRRIVGIHPGGSVRKNHLHKRWQPHKFAELVKTIRARCNAVVLLFGGPDEERLLSEISPATPLEVFHVLNDDLLLTSGIISKCDHFVSNDSALMHIAGALQVPTTAIFGPTSRDWVRIPGAPRTEVAQEMDCQPCFRYSPRPLRCRFGDFRCLDRISAQEVADVVCASLGRLQRACESPIPVEA